MSRFTSHLGLELVENADGDAMTRDGRCVWRLAYSLVYDVGAEGSGESICVPAGFVTDLASIPSIVWPLFPADGPYAKAAVVHDFLYVRRGVVGGHHYSRAEADGIFREAMAVVRVPAWRRAVIWAAVRAGGARGWGS